MQVSAMDECNRVAMLVKGTKGYDERMAVLRKELGEASHRLPSEYRLPLDPCVQVCSCRICLICPGDDSRNI